MAFPSLGNSDHVNVSASIDFPSNSQWDAPFHCIAYNYSCADWGGLCNHLRDVPWEDVFKVAASAAASEICECVQVGIKMLSKNTCERVRLIIKLPAISLQACKFDLLKMNFFTHILQGF